MRTSPHLRIASTTLVLLAGTGLLAGEAGHSDPAVPEAPAQVALETSTTALEAVLAFAKAKTLRHEATAPGPIRIHAIGHALPAEAKAMLVCANKALDQLEEMTGRNQVFVRPKAPENETYQLIVLADDKVYLALVDALRQQRLLPPPPEGRDDLLKKCRGFPLRKVMITTWTSSHLLSSQWAVYATACLATDGFYRQRGSRCPTWIREGLAAELQRSITRMIRCTTIAYEYRTGGGIDSWPGVVATMIAKRSKQLLPAETLFEHSLDAMPAETYQQIWSLCTYLSRLCAAKPGKDSLFLRILTRTAAGEAAHVVVKDLFKMRDPALTDAWRQWALANKSLR